MGIDEPIYLATKELLKRILLLCYSNTHSPKTINLAYDPIDYIDKKMFLNLESEHNAINIHSPNDFGSLIEKSTFGSFIFDVDIKKIEEMYKNCEKFLSKGESIPIEGLSKLNFFADDDIVEFKGIKAKVKGKSKALLVCLNENPNVPYSASVIASKCNQYITTPYYVFKNNKDIYDTIRTLKNKLKVKKSEFFPIHKHFNNWIWDQK